MRTCTRRTPASGSCQRSCNSPLVRGHSTSHAPRPDGPASDPRRSASRSNWQTSGHALPLDLRHSRPGPAGASDRVAQDNNSMIAAGSVVDGLRRCPARSVVLRLLATANGAAQGRGMSACSARVASPNMTNSCGTAPHRPN